MSIQPSDIFDTPKRPETASLWLLERFMRSEWVLSLANRFQLNQPLIEAHVDNVSNPSVKTMIVAGLFKRLKKPVVFLTSDPLTAQKYQYELRQYVQNDEDIELYPAEEFSPYESSIFSVRSLQTQYRVLQRLRRQEPFILLATGRNLMLRHMAMDEMERYAIRLKVGEDSPPLQLVESVQVLGYQKTGMIMEPGEFSSRGDIFDIYPVNGDPVRVEFFGDTVESIRLIDVDNQRSIASTQETVILPRSGIILTPENKTLLEQRMTERFEIQKKTLTELDAEGLETTLNNQIQALEQAFLPDGIDYYGPLVHDDYRTLVDELPTDALTVIDDWALLTNAMAGLSDRLTHQLDDSLHKGRLLDTGQRLHHTDAEALQHLKTQCSKRLFLDTFRLEDATGVSAGEAVRTYQITIQAPDQFKADLRAATEYCKERRREGFQIIITTDHPQRVMDICKEHDVPAIYWSEQGLSAEEVSWLSHEVVITRYGPHDGFLLPEEKLIHISDTELFGRRLKKVLTDSKRAKRRDDIDVINSINDLRPGDFVVHVKHGIGRFAEMSRITLDGEVREYLSIHYANNDKLYVPVDQVHLLSRYRGAGEAPPKLNKMGGIEWSSVKKKVKKSIQSIAKDLMRLYAARARSRGFVFEPDSPWQVEMEEAFPYTETPDQWDAILNTKNDMESDKPMDRLICGDVGFGKTEVAVRAIFKAVLSGKQVAVLVPTTILAQQHFNTISERFQPYPVRVGLLSRFRSPKEQKEVCQRVSVGEMDVVVGTHRLLQKDVKFKDLGLVVIDEEQRFGVAHKEKLKHLRTEVDVLTLSATPIPRTLYMALSGVRDMSLIKTPPVNRSPIKTFVGPYNPAQIRMAILQEVDRGGQVYFVHNRVKTIYAVQKELEELIPEVRFAVGHGQMNETDLENVMLDFANRAFDVLICTTIIESGLDIPNVNTIIVDRADRFGLSQLYQIRGRVGRSNIQAYAYCYYEPDKMLTQDATDRLRAIREFTTLGSGYQVAMRDLEIRGVGNILGDEQHGHMVAVGFDMYCQMLDESIEELKGNVEEKKESTIIDLNVTALIPDEYVADRDVKLSEYKRLAGVDSPKALEIIQAEWQDRFGPIPWETQQLIKLVELRIMATDMGIPLVRADDDAIRISVPFGLQEWMKFQNQLPKNLASKTRWVPALSSKQGSLPVVVVKHLGMDGEDQVNFLMELFTQLVKLVNALKAAVAAASQK